MRPVLLLLLAAALLAAGCGARSSTPFTAQGTIGCLKKHGFTGATTDPGKVGFIAGFAANGGIRAASPGRNVVTIAFTEDATSVGSTEKAFKLHAPAGLRSHIRDVMSSNRNAVVVWTTAPTSDEADTVNRCLAP